MTIGTPRLCIGLVNTRGVPSDGVKDKVFHALVNLGIPLSDRQEKSKHFRINAGVTLSRFKLAMNTRWRKFATSGMIVKTSGHSGLHPKPSCDRRLSCLGFGSNFGSAHKIFGMSKNCRKYSRRCIVVWTSCVILGHRVAIVSPSCRHPVGSCSHRLYFVWSSATPGFYSTR